MTKNKNWIKRHPVWSGIIGFFVLMILIGVFIPEDNSKEKIYVCSDGSEVSNPNDCSKELTENSQSQVNVCTPNWQCSSWSACSSSGKQTRTCSDSNNCGVLTNKPSESQSCTPPVEEKSDKATIGEKNALDTALSYLRYSSFSYSGLIEQLEFEGYTHEEAVYGADNCGADWNEQAALTAQSYLDYSAFSREGLIEQLEFEGFTKEQAEYGVQAVGY